jgi:hypothetical protein
MRYTSVGWTVVVPVSPRRRFGFFAWSRWRLPARERNTLPPAVILKRFATDFFVFIPFGRRINSIQFPRKERAIYGRRTLEARGIFRRFDGGNNSLDHPVSVHPLPDVGGYWLPAFSHAGGQTVFPAFGRVPRPGRKVVRLGCCTASHAPRCCREQQCQKPISNTCFFHVSTPSKVPCGGLLVLLSKALTGQDLGCAGVTTSPS